MHRAHKIGGAAPAHRRRRFEEPGGAEKPKEPGGDSDAKGRRGGGGGGGGNENDAADEDAATAAAAATTLSVGDFTKRMLIMRPYTLQSNDVILFALAFRGATPPAEWKIWMKTACPFINIDGFTLHYEAAYALIKRLIEERDDDGTRFSVDVAAKRIYVDTPPRKRLAFPLATDDYSIYVDSAGQPWPFGAEEDARAPPPVAGEWCYNT